MNSTSWTHNSAWKAMVTFGALLAALLVFAPSAFAAGAVTVGGKAQVTNTDGDTIRVREGAGTQNKQVTEAHEGDTVTVLAGPSKDSKGNVWYKVQAPNASGWVLSDFLAGKGAPAAQPASKASQPATKSSQPATTKLTGFGRVANTDGDPLRVRGAASARGSVISNLSPRASVIIKQGPVTDSSNVAWYQVSGEGVTGWVMAQYLAQASAPPQLSAQQKPQAVAAKIKDFAKVANTDGDPLRVRSAASGKGSVITNLSPGTSVAVKQGPVTDSSNTAWYQVSSGGMTGWVMAQYLTQEAAPAQPAAQTKPAAQPKIEVKPAAQPATPKAQPATQQASDPRSGTSRGASPPVAVRSSSLANTIVGTAMRYVGYRYRFGGASPSGFDCSGFVKYVVNKSGFGLSRDMGSMIASGTRVSSNSLQPGDLLFFSNTYKRGLSHVGIYLGNGKFVHAENESTGVTVSALWSAYWVSHYTTAVRLR